ncbi:unnamed protein product [Pseudo-nitzschia multistriata]|uniref:EF-hand domain-containing protein n=1 Tax=Pseudo-nitzschia multistriata TaxID=183589 RepID=A0A448Z9D2_9STRA|nr:unnamed protein product [Pseudo-nitzschia multistriata]
MFGSGTKLNEASYKTMFSSFDKDNSGYIDKSDLKKITKGILPANGVDMIIGFVDKSGDGKIDFNEFKSVMKKIETAKKFNLGK